MKMSCTFMLKYHIIKYLEACRNMLMNIPNLDIFGNVVVWLTYLNILYQYIKCQEHEHIRLK